MNALEIIAQDVARLTVERSTFQVLYLEEVQKREVLEKQIEELKSQLEHQQQEGSMEE
jgi:hypothetical protein|uniref:Uncharacterized protein n=2 Tax=unclassified Caudoviricetes TaxID=2788787 RepID=A0A8S5TT12_9CAUD|nr:MAG TPA: hypothetical protein [Siphoviridae sp. ctojb20]DAF91344.1 MAG TPA: hypothetical protein [Siphoviridae sp. ctKun47]